jgi:sirohydrochlorin ferrochelatase
VTAAGQGCAAGVVLVAHGSADPRAGEMTRSLAQAVAARAPTHDVRVAFLDHAPPRPGDVLAELAARGHRAAVLVPLLLTSAYHDQVDMPAVLTAAGDLPMSVTRTAALGGHPLVLAGVRRRLREAVGSGTYDGVVLAAAGTRDAAARSTVDDAARELGAALGVPAEAAFASGSPITGAVAVETLRAAGCTRIAVASYFLACGRLYDTVTASALDAGALAPVAAPLGNVAELARLVLDRVPARSLSAA